MDTEALRRSTYKLLTENNAVAERATGGVHDTMAQGSPDYPYVVMTLIDGVPIYNQTATLNTFRLQIDVYHKDGNATDGEVLMEKCEAALHGQTMIDDTGYYFDGKSVASTRRKTQEAPNVWRNGQDFTVLLQAR